MEGFTMKIQMTVASLALLIAASAFADKKSECNDYVRMKANKIVDGKVAEMEKKKAKYSRELNIADDKKQLYDECMKKK